MKTMVISGWLFSGTIALLVIFTVSYLSIVGDPVPQLLEQWGGIIIGFYFGQFVSIVKDYMNQ